MVSVAISGGAVAGVSKKCRSMDLVQVVGEGW